MTVGTRSGMGRPCNVASAFSAGERESMFSYIPTRHRHSELVTLVQKSKVDGTGDMSYRSVAYDVRSKR
jgi:hypothetical protein